MSPIFDEEPDCASRWFLISGKPEAAFPPPPPVALLLASPAAVPVCASRWFLISGKPHNR
jgi:hypothetical protein